MTIEQERLTPTQEDRDVERQLRAAWTDFLDANPDDLTSPEDLPDHALVTCDQFVDIVRNALAAIEEDAALKSPPIAGGEGDVLRDAISAGLQAFCANTPDFAMSSAMRRDAADFILGQPGLRADLPADVRRIVIAARACAFGDGTSEGIAELDAASEAFAERVKWDDEPEEECVGHQWIKGVGAAGYCTLCDAPMPPDVEARYTGTTSGDVGKLCEELGRFARWSLDDVGDDDSPCVQARNARKMIEAATLIESQAARISALEKALEPMVRECQHIEQGYTFDLPDHQTQFPQITMGDLRTARALLNPTPTEER